MPARRPAWAAQAATPIRRADADEIARLARTFRSRLEGWKPARGQETAWNERLRLTSNVAEMLEYPIGTKPEHHVFEFEGQPVGLMSVERPGVVAQDALYVDFLVTHPGSSGVGSALIEAAVNESARLGAGGRIRLEAKGSAEPFYRALGFEGDLKHLQLDPAKASDSNPWRHDGVRWHLARFPKGELFDSFAAMAASRA